MSPCPPLPGERKRVGKSRTCQLHCGRQRPMDGLCQAAPWSGNRRRALRLLDPRRVRSLISCKADFEVADVFRDDGLSRHRKERTVRRDPVPPIEAKTASLRRSHRPQECRFSRPRPRRRLSTTQMRLQVRGVGDYHDHVHLFSVSEVLYHLTMQRFPSRLCLDDLPGDNGSLPPDRWRDTISDTRDRKPHVLEE
jgi:hypothetical protein